MEPDVLGNGRLPEGKRPTWNAVKAQGCHKISLRFVEMVKIVEYTAFADGPVQVKIPVFTPRCCARANGAQNVT
jgi:hypothetical protein